VDDSGANTLRLTFAREDAETIREGLARLGRVMRAALA
jgi:DNA-binding transcriptional MocR family regulator